MSKFNLQGVTFVTMLNTGEPIKHSTSNSKGTWITMEPNN